jgi:hypothetical protein
LVTSRPIWRRLSVSVVDRCWASVLQTRKSTPDRPRVIMLFIAFPPAPPTPITQILGANSTHTWLCRTYRGPEIPPHGKLSMPARGCQGSGTLTGWWWSSCCGRWITFGEGEGMGILGTFFGGGCTVSTFSGSGDGLDRTSSTLSSMAMGEVCSMDGVVLGWGFAALLCDLKAF